MRNVANAAVNRRLPWFRLIAETAADYIAVLDAQGRRQYVNPALEQLLGPERAGPGGSAFENVHPEDRERLQALFRQSVEDGIGRRDEFRVVLPDGMD